MDNIHASCIALAGKGVLLRGAAGAGKSDLALRLIEAGWSLVADDRVELSVEAGQLVARPPAVLAGRIEVRGVGIASMDWQGRTTVALLCDLVAPDAVERLPDPLWETVLGVALPVRRLAPFEASAPAKLRLFVAAAPGATAASEVVQ